MQRNICLKLDIVDSRTRVYEAWLEQMIQELGNRSINFLIEPTRRAGDELFMLLPDMASAWRAIRTIYQLLRQSEQQIYLGIGRGTVEAGELDSEKVDGSAIWRAADALQELKQTNATVIFSQMQDAAFRYNIKVSDDAVVNEYHQQHLFSMIELMQRRTSLQQAASDLKFFHPEYSNQVYARMLYADDPGPHGEVNFSKHLMRAQHKLLDQLEQTWIAYFDREVKA